MTLNRPARGPLLPRGKVRPLLSGAEGMRARLMRERARDLRKNPTEAERFLWQHIRRRQLGGFRFRRQHTIGPYIVDFYCFEERVAVEVDGGQHSGQAAYDAERTSFLESEGVRVLRFWNNQVLAEIESVKHVILEVLASG